MKITGIQTPAVTANECELTSFLDVHLPKLTDRTVVVVTSKLVSLCEGSAVPVASVERAALAKQEADYYLSKTHSKYGMTLTVKSDILIASAGIDESNGDSNYVLWPKDPQSSANLIRKHLSMSHGCHIGVIITDSRVTPLRRGTIGIGLAHSGFLALNNYVGRKDVFGNELKVTVANVLDGLAAAAVAVMGEGSERVPLAIIEGADFIKFQDDDPTAPELSEIRVPLEEDLYSEMLMLIPWDKTPKKH